MLSRGKKWTSAGLLGLVPCLLVGVLWYASYQRQLRLPHLVGINHAASTSQLLFSPDGKTLISASADPDDSEILHIWNLKPSRSLGVWTFGSHGSNDGQCPTVASLDWAPDGRTLGIGCGRRTPAMLWDVPTRKRLTWSLHSANSLQFSTDGKAIAVSGANSKYDDPYGEVVVRIQERDSGRICWQRELHEKDPWFSETRTLGFSPDEKYLLVRHNGETLWLERVSGKTQFRTRYRGELSPDRTLCVRSKFYLPVSVWRNSPDPNEKPLLVLPALQTTEDAVAISPDNALLARSVRLGTEIWDLKTHQLVRRLTTDHTVLSLAFSPDGTMLATGLQGDGRENTLLTWRLR